MKAGQPFDIINVMRPSQDASTSTAPHSRRIADEDALPQELLADGPLFQDDTTVFGPDDAPPKRRRAPGLVGEKHARISYTDVQVSRRLI